LEQPGSGSAATGNVVVDASGRTRSWLAKKGAITIIRDKIHLVGGGKNTT